MTTQELIKTLRDALENSTFACGNCGFVKTETEMNLSHLPFFCPRCVKEQKFYNEMLFSIVKYLPKLLNALEDVERRAEAGEKIISILRDTAKEDLEEIEQQGAHCEAACVGWAQNLIAAYDESVKKSD